VQYFAAGSMTRAASPPGGAGAAAGCIVCAGTFAPAGAPHFVQNCLPAFNCAPHCLQTAMSEFPS
jgi:hypothetical protein